MEKTKSNIQKLQKSRKYTKNIIIILILVLLIILLSILIDYFLKQQNKIELIQTSNQSKSQMMGYIIKTKQGKVIAIDGGTKEDTENFIKNINNLGGKIDIWFITHPHKDHVGVLNSIIEQNIDLKLGKIYYTANDLNWYLKYDPERAYEAEDFYKTITNSKIKDKVEEVTLNQIINIDNIGFEILGVKNPEITVNPFNNSSMVIKLKVNEKEVLFLADTGAESGRKLLQNQGDKLKADIVQMAHHGQAGVTKEVYEKISPKICLWPTPDWLWDNNPETGYNTGPYKTIETRQWMENLSVKQNFVAKDGDIKLEIW